MPTPIYDPSIYAQEISFANIRTLSGTLETNYYITTDEGMEGHWCYDPSDTSSADNLGTVLVTSDGKRIKRIYSGSINVQWFGAMGNDTNDDTVAIQSALNYSWTVGVPLFFPKGKYIITSTLNVYDLLEVYGESSTVDTDKATFFAVSGLTDFVKHINYQPGDVVNEIKGFFRNISVKFLDSGPSPAKNSVFFNKIEFNNFEFSGNRITDFGTFLYGDMGTLSVIERNTFMAVKKAVLCSTPVKDQFTMKRLTDCFIRDNYFNATTKVENTAIVKDMRLGHLTFTGNFCEFFESVFDIANDTTIVAGSQIDGNIFDFIPFFFKGGGTTILYNLKINSNIFTGMTNAMANGGFPTWSDWASERIKTSKWGLFKDVLRFYGVEFTGNKVEGIDMIIDCDNTVMIGEFILKGNSWMKSDSSYRYVDRTISVEELNTMIYAKAWDKTALPNRGIYWDDLKI